MGGAGSEHSRVRGAESRIEFAMAGAFSLLVAATLAYVHSLFEPLVPAVRLWSWTTYTAVVVVIMLLVPLVVWWRRPDDEEIVRFWSPVGKWVAILFDLAAAASVWLLLPFASEPLRLLMVIFYAAVISGQVISTAESLGTITFGVVTIFGSAAIFFLGTPGPYSVPLAVFLLAFGGLMIGVAFLLKIAIRSAIRARLAAEATSKELARALADANDARSSKTRFIAAVTHDLRQPLQAAALFFNQHAETADPARRALTANGARLAFGEAATLLDGLLEHLRLDAGAVRAAPERILAHQIVSRVVEEVGPVAAASDMVVRSVVSTRPIICDPTLTARILRNFLHNAVRHSRGRRVLVGTRAHGNTVRLYVIDDGRGIPASDPEALFEEAASLGGSMERRGGMGLGLPSARRMAHLMAGRVGTDPRWAGGAAFYVELPAG